MIKFKSLWLIGVFAVSVAALTGTRYQQLLGELNQGEFSKEKLLLNIGLNIVQPETLALEQEVSNLNNEIHTYCEALSLHPEQADLIAVQNSWKKAMLTYHKLDAVAFGPLVDNGRFLADNIYSWPLVNSCGVDRAVVDLKKSGQYNPQILFTSKGLDALEYLFFDESLGTVCNPNSPRNKEIVDWSKLPTEEKILDRCKFAKEIVQELEVKSSDLVAAWDPNQGNYAKKLVDGTIFETLNSAINQISDALFSIEYMKDFRLAKPMGLHKECISDNNICPEQVEHIWSGHSLEAMEVQAQYFKKAFFGSLNPNENGFGFDDYLTSVGHQDMANEILIHIDKVLEDIQVLKVQGSLEEQIVASQYQSCQGQEGTSGTLCSLFHNIRGITTLMKTDVMIALSLQAPPTFQGDND